MEDRNKPVTRSSAVYPHYGSRSGPNSHHNDQQYRRHFLTILGIVGLMAVVGACGAFILATLFRLDLYMPQLPELRVDSFSVSNFTSTNGSRVSFVSEIQLTTRNPSGKVSISYDHIVVSMYYKFMLLCQSSLAPFSQEAKNKTYLVVKLAAGGNVVEKWVVEGINGDIGQNGRVEFDFELTSWVNWDSTMGSSKDFLKVFCGNLTVSIPSNWRPGGLIYRPGHCRVGKGPDDDDSFYK